MTHLRIAFRADASDVIGSGHVMRCLALADQLKIAGHHTRFICNALPKYLLAKLHDSGHELRLLTPDQPLFPDSIMNDNHLLPQALVKDAQASVAHLQDQMWDWLVVDHYDIMSIWENIVRRSARRILVIDDLCDRPHDCDVLLNQNHGEHLPSCYIGLLPEGCTILYGPRFALLRPDFQKYHDSCQLIRQGVIKRLLISFGGVDEPNYTAMTVRAVASLNHPELNVDVVVGAQYPYFKEIAILCEQHGYQLHIQTDSMAELMKSADLAIGAAGSTSWERCCLGLPSILFSIANNQDSIAAGLQNLGAALYLNVPSSEVHNRLLLELDQLLHDTKKLMMLSENSFALVDGRGVERVISVLLSQS